ncbi:hypothetical protein R3P38DRAFT_3229586 [Favolaschia claudopus]|uniref:Uncharacterized protein n=1 Tax=Favolaschia claudopus TaxID=2862362 RepID=A0AAV9ZNR4_9AGAR
MLPVSTAGSNESQTSTPRGDTIPSHPQLRCSRNFMDPLMIAVRAIANFPAIFPYPLLLRHAYPSISLASSLYLFALVFSDHLQIRSDNQRQLGD